MKKAIALTMLLAMPGCFGEQPAYADPPAAADFDPFAGLGLKDGESMPPLACMARDWFITALKAHDGSDLVKLTEPAAMFYRGMFTALPVTPPGYPVGESVEIAVKVIEGKDEKAHLTGVAVFTLGDNIVCNRLPVTEDTLNQLFRAGGLMVKGSI